MFVRPESLGAGASRLRPGQAESRDGARGRVTSLRTLPIERFSARTLPRALVATARRLPDATFIRFVDPAAPERPPRAITFVAFAAGVGRAAVFLRGAGLGPGGRVLLLAENSPEWQMIAL